MRHVDKLMHLAISVTFSLTIPGGGRAYPGAFDIFSFFVLIAPTREYHMVVQFTQILP